MSVTDEAYMDDAELITYLKSENEQLKIDNKLLHETMEELGDEVRICKSMLVTAKDEIDSLNARIKTLESQIYACEALKDLAIAELEAYVATKKFFEGEG